MTTIDDLLLAPHRLFVKAQKAKELAMHLEAKATKTTSKLTGMPGGGSDKGQTLAKLVDAKIEWAKYTDLYVEATDYVRDFINNSTLSDRAKLILIRRYIVWDTWHDIVEFVGKEGYEISERNVYRLHSSAVKNLGGFNEEDTHFISESL